MRSFVLMATCLLGTSAHLMSQCNLTAYVNGVYGCIGDGSGMGQAIGGAPPYSLAFQTRSAVNGQWSWAAFSNNDPDGSHFYSAPLSAWENMDAISVTITDAMNCTAQAVSTMLASDYPEATFVRTQDCSTGSTTWDLNPTTAWQIWGTPQSFSVDNGPQQPFAGSWTWMGSGWRNTTLPTTGTHTVHISGFPGTYASFCPTSYSYTAVPITPGDCGVNILLRAALDGALPTGTLMTDGLRSANLIPLNQPYTALGYTFTGSPANVSISPAQLAVTGNDAIVDWVVVELRSNTTTVVYSKPALLQADGDVMDTDGDTYLNFPVAAGNYYVVIRHRNHLGVMTATTRALSVDPSQAAGLIDFRLSSTTTYGANARVQKGTVWCLWAGDATHNGTIAYTGVGNDRDPILVAIGGSTPTITLSGQYRLEDTNLDGQVKYTGANNDRDIILQNIGGSTPTNTRTQQLP